MDLPLRVPELEAGPFHLREWTENDSPLVREAGNDPHILGLWLRNVELGRAFLGYWVVASARGRRAATHALLAVNEFGLVVLKLPRLELWIEPWNLASIAAESGQAIGGRGDWGAGRKSMENGATC